MIRKFLIIFALSFSSIFIGDVKAEFGDADFPIGLFEDGPKSYHDAWCRKIKNECRVRFQGKAMWVEGQGGIELDQFITYKYDVEGNEFYNYFYYVSKKGQKREALFLFVNPSAQRDFQKAFLKWIEQDKNPAPNYRTPCSQGPQETHNRDCDLNPYEKPLIKDWKQKTTD